MYLLNGLLRKKRSLRSFSLLSRHRMLKEEKHVWI